MHNAGAWRNDFEVRERLLSPFEELVALTVALVLSFNVALQRHWGSEDIDLNGVVNNQFGGHLRVNLLRVPTHRLVRLTHDRKVDHTRNSGEVLKNDSRRRELNLILRLRLWIPRGN